MIKELKLVSHYWSKLQGDAQNMFCKSHLISIFSFDYQKKQIVWVRPSLFRTQTAQCKGRDGWGCGLAQGKKKNPKKKPQWVGIAGYQVPTKQLHHSPPQQNREGENKMEKSFGSRARLFAKAKEKAVCGPKENEMYIMCFPSADGECPVPSQDTEHVVSEDKVHH